MNSRTSNDKPEMAFNAPLMDDMSIRRILSTVAPIQNRNYVVMEVKGNLVKEERQAAIDRFSCSSFKKVRRCDDWRAIHGIQAADFQAIAGSEGRKRRTLNFRRNGLKRGEGN